MGLLGTSWWQRLGALPCLPLLAWEVLRGRTARRQLVCWGPSQLQLWMPDDQGPLGFFALLNLLAGTMAWVGPSLSLSEQAAQADSRWCDFLPGVFSLSDLRQRTGIAFSDRAEIEDQYAATRGLKKDLALVLRSLLVSWLPPAPPVCPERLSLFGLNLANPTMAEALDQLQQWTQAPQPRLVGFLNAHCVNVSYRHSEYRETLGNCDWLLADGFGLRLAGLLLQQPIRDNVNGTDLFPPLCERLQADATRVFLFGAKPGVAEAVAQWMSVHAPGLEVVGVQHGFLEADQQEPFLQRLQQCRPQLTLVALGVPAQELWLQRNREKLPPGLYLAVGGLFDFYSGQTPRAPQWLREIGLEWAYRLWQEPGRMWKRYLVGNFLFAFHAWKEYRKRGIHR